MSTFCDGVCADTITNTILTQDLQIAFPCLGDRRFGNATDNDLIASIPFSLVNEILSGMEKTHKAGTRYPIPFQISTPKFFENLKSRLDKFTDTAPVLRLLNRARELEKSEKIIKRLEERISQIELEKYE